MIWVLKKTKLPPKYGVWDKKKYEGPKKYLQLPLNEYRHTVLCILLKKLDGVGPVDNTPSTD